MMQGSDDSVDQPADCCGPSPPFIYYGTAPVGTPSKGWENCHGTVCYLMVPFTASDNENTKKSIPS